MDCAVVLTSFFNHTSAEFSTAGDFNLIQASDDRETGEALLFVTGQDHRVLVILEADVLWFSTRADIFISMWKLQSKLGIKKQRCPVLRV